MRRAASLISILLVSCIDPFKIELTKLDEQLVVDGMITDQPGPYVVKLFKTKALSDQISNSTDVKGAVVVITNSDGVSETLTESSPGNYVTNASGIQGVVGKTYQLHITTAEGTIYESELEKLVEVGAIRNVYHEFQKVEEPTIANSLDSDNGFQVYVDADVLPDQEGRIRWRVTRTFEIFTYPSQRIRYVSRPGGATVIVPDPPACSGWIYTPATGLAPVSNCTCCSCWVTDYRFPVISNPKFEENHMQPKVPLDFISANRRIFYRKCHLRIEQMSVSESVYDFWANVTKQRASGNDLFQTPMPKTSGNIKAVTPGAKQALGIFAVSSVKVANHVVQRNEIPYSMPQIDTLKFSCLEAYKFSTINKPTFW
jgi:hypothetical protein